MKLTRLTFSFLFLFLLLPFVLTANDGEEAFVDAESAGPDFAFQGEYKGTIGTDDGEKEYGAQVIALGDGKFTIVGYQGGLPGDGWKRGDEQVTASASLIDGQVQAETDHASITVMNGELTVTVGDRVLGTLKKVERKSPSLGAEPPEGALVLFDGSSAENFENGKLVEDQLLGATNCVSKQKLGDHVLHIEFRTPFMPKSSGQARGNSGVYVQGRYEVQVLDSFGLKGENNECGGIYSISEPIFKYVFPTTLVANLRYRVYRRAF